MKVLVSGATGFIGRAVSENLLSKFNYKVLGTTRNLVINMSSPVPLVPVGEVSASTDWSEALNDIEVVIHLAARAHVLGETSPDPLAEFRRINVDGALALAHQALSAGVRRFIFISSIGVNGSQTLSKSFNESSLPIPHADYALSKLEAEQGLRDFVKGTAMELVIIRPPLVYAGHAPGNFQRLLKVVDCGVPLPFAAVNNRRSMISLENLVDFIALCVEHPAAANELFLVSDGIDVSTPEIISHLAEGMGRKVFLVPVPDVLMRWGARLLGKQSVYHQLCGSLTVDSSKARDLLGWTPPVTPAEALFRAGQSFKLKRAALALKAGVRKHG